MEHFCIKTSANGWTYVIDFFDLCAYISPTMFKDREISNFNQGSSVIHWLPVTYGRTSELGRT